MWVEILSANPGPVADVLAGVAADLEETVAALRGLGSADADRRSAGTHAIEDVLRRGNAGRVRVPGKHGAAPTAYETVAVLIGDKPGELAAIFADAGRAGVNIEDVRIEHATGQQAGPSRSWSSPAPPRSSARPSRNGAGPSAAEPATRTAPATRTGPLPVPGPPPVRGTWAPPALGNLVRGRSLARPSPPRVPGRCPPPWKPHAPP